MTLADADVTAAIIASDPGAAAWLALADQCVGCIDPRAAKDLRDAVRSHGTSSPAALDALARIILGLECDARDAETASARRAFELWLGAAERELGPGFGAHARMLAELLSSHNLHKEAVRVLLRATHESDPEGWRTACALGEELCAAGETAQALEVMRRITEASLPEPHALAVRASFARVAMRMGAYDDAIALYRELARDETTEGARREAALDAALAARSSGDEPAARAELTALLGAIAEDGGLATVFGTRVVDSLLELLLVAEDEAAIAVQQGLVTAVAAACGPTSAAAAQERANLSVVLRAVGHEEEAEAIARELTAPGGPSFERSRPHLLPFVRHDA